MASTIFRVIVNLERVPAITPPIEQVPFACRPTNTNDENNNDTMTSTSKRRRGQSLHIDLANGSHHSPLDDLPPLAAIFLILFDVKAGYTIAWQRSTPGLELDESVEFKSLPSGLHHVEEDLIYFVHGEDYAGISAFKNSPSEEEGDRNALMLAVGALVPLTFGRLGKSWKFAESLKELARYEGSL